MLGGASTVSFSSNMARSQDKIYKLPTAAPRLTTSRKAKKEQLKEPLNTAINS